MKCPDCGSSLRVYRTYNKSETVTRQYRQCVQCGSRHITEIAYIARIGQKQRTAIDDLTRWGMSQSKAKALHQKYPAHTLKSYAGALPVLVQTYEQRTGKTVRDRAGFLAWAIEQQLPLPVRDNTGHQRDGFFADLPNDYAPAAVKELSPDETLWRKKLDELSTQMTGATFSMCLQNTYTLPRQNGKLLVHVASKYVKELLDNRLKKTIARTMGDLEVEFIHD
jgi:hypothetical protein